jgi:phosphoketolase
VRSIAGAQETIEAFRQRLQEHRSYIREEGNDPPEILEWTWAGDGASAS